MKTSLKPSMRLRRRGLNHLQRKYSAFLSFKFTALLALSAGNAFASCPPGSLVIDETKGNGQVVLSGRNTSNVPITFSIAVETSQFFMLTPDSVTETLQARESKDVITLTRTSDTQKGYYRYSTECTVGNKDADHDDQVVYLMPYATGESYRVLQGYGSRFSHTGLETYAVDFRMVEGTPVHAARAGVVAEIEESHSIGCWKDGCGRYANYIIILHDDETTGEYYHLQQNGALVTPGEYVEAGQLIGLSGNTGHTTMPHLHFGVYRAEAGGREQSIPVSFITGNGIINRPRNGGRYLATSPGKPGAAEHTTSAMTNQGLN